ncbi:MAG: zinc ribbon-containing protein [Pseudomonadota bacterium]
MSENKLINAYNTMVKRLHDAFVGAEKKITPNLEHGLDTAKKKMIELGEATQEEADKISEYLKRDVEEAAHHLADTEEELSEWLKFDIELIEDFAIESFLSVADQTKLELMKLERRAREASTYHTGEITGPGTLVCESCSETLHFKKTSHIPPCPKCQGSTFQRG